MSTAVAHNGVVYTAGVCGENGGDVKQQTQDALDYLERVLIDANSSVSRILSMQIWLADINRDFAAMNEVYDKWIEANFPKGKRPTRACVEAKIAAPEYHVEFRCGVGLVLTRCIAPYLMCAPKLSIA